MLLPWLVNETLEGDELAFVQRHLDQCPECRHEVEWLRELHAACIAGEALPGASAAFRNLRREPEAPSDGRGSLVVVFDPATSQAEVQRILRSAGARIVDGPTQANAYVLEVPVGQTGRAAQAIKAERATLLTDLSWSSKMTILRKH